MQSREELKFREYEWDTRLGKIAYECDRAAHSIKDFKKLFKDKISNRDNAELTAIANDLEEMSRDIGIIERHYD